MSRKMPFVIVPLLAGASGITLASPPADSAYFTDAQTSQVQDATSQSIGQVNMITCVMSSMRPDALVNQGPYVALIDQNKCDASKQSSSSNSADSSGGSQAPDYMTAVVNSTRASNADPMLVSAWISINQQGTAVTVFAHISATAAPSSSDPYGAFRLDYCGKPSGGSSCMMNGFMQAGNGTLSYYEADSGGGGGGGGGGSQTTALQLTSVGTTNGSGSLNAPDNQGGQVAFDFAYDSKYFLRSSGGTSQCFSRDATDPATGISVWRYGLYDSTTGAEITRNSGFPIQYASGGTTYQGYIGYYGLSTQPGAPTPTNGSTVQKVDYSNGSATTASYKLVINGGRLARYTMQQTNLKALDQIPFNAFVNDVGSSGLPDSNTQYVMNWDEHSGAFIVTAEMQCGPSGCQSGALSNGAPSVSVNPSFWSSTGLQGWSQSLGGGDLFIALNSPATPLDTTAVVYHTQDLVYPGDNTVPAALYCVNNCPTAASMQAYFQQSGGNPPVQSPYVDSTYNNFQAASAAVSYSVDSSGTLTDSMQAQVIDTNASDYQNYPQYQNGLMSGRLVGNLSDLRCGGTDQNPQYCDWAANNANVYYQWQTGPSSWDQFTAVEDSNNVIVKFDAPLNVSFTVPANAVGSGSTGVPYGSYAGTSLVLQYADFGDLWGIPGTCFSSATNLPVACNDPTARYVSAFAIPYDPTANPQQGVVTTTSSGVTTTYLVKWLDREIRFAQKPTATCTGAPDNLATASATLPNASGLQDPSNSSSSVYNGVEPTFTTTPAPRVIQGQVMY